MTPCVQEYEKQYLSEAFEVELGRVVDEANSLINEARTLFPHHLSFNPFVSWSQHTRDPCLFALVPTLGFGAGAPAQMAAPDPPPPANPSRLLPVSTRVIARWLHAEASLLLERRMCSLPSVNLTCDTTQ